MICKGRKRRIFVSVERFKEEEVVWNAKVKRHEKKESDRRTNQGARVRKGSSDAVLLFLYLSCFYLGAKESFHLHCSFWCNGV